MKGTVKGRYRHSACANQSSMFIFGGIDQNQERFNDINEFNFDSQMWTRVIASGATPSTRTFHETLMFKGVMYVFGGFDGMKRNDIYRILFDEEDKKKNLQEQEVRQLGWSYSLINQSMDEIMEANSEGTNHSAGQRSYHFNSQRGMVGENLVQNSLVPVPSRMTSSTQKQPPRNQQFFTNEYFINLPIGQWRRVQPLGNTNFTPRTGHDCLQVKEKIYLFGGTDDDDRKNDLYEYDIFMNKWSLLPSKG